MSESTQLRPSQCKKPFCHAASSSAKVGSSAPRVLSASRLAGTEATRTKDHEMSPTTKTPQAAASQHASLCWKSTSHRRWEAKGHPADACPRAPAPETSTRLVAFVGPATSGSSTWWQPRKVETGKPARWNASSWRWAAAERGMTMPARSAGARSAEHLLVSRSEAMGLIELAATSLFPSVLTLWSANSASIFGAFPRKAVLSKATNA
mmetsp:Transcript_65336/g.199993  ORF Transcript_65336/g.199993 Transcript_65336/m.199993 type:complete len:208 (+) Transcript_65336:473-1096(+)